MTRDQSTSLSCAVLTIVLSVCAVWLPISWCHAQSPFTDAPKSHVIRSSAADGQASVSLEFDVAGNDDDDGSKLENRLNFSPLRSTAGISMISLIDPSKRVIWRKTPEALGLTARDASHHPELGDTILLPQLRDAPWGRWTLKIDRNPKSAKAARFLFAYQVLPRFQLSMTSVGTSVTAGEPMVLIVRPTDHGASLPGLGQIKVRVFDAGGSQMAVPMALENARASSGILISNEPGSYLARFSLPKAGDYRLEAQLNFSGRQGPLTARSTMSLKVGAGSGALTLSGVQFEKSPGSSGSGSPSCVSAVVFDFAVDVAAPGTYACNVRLSGSGPGPASAGRFVSGSAVLPIGAGRISVKASSATLLALGGPLTELKQVGLIRYGDQGAGVIAELTHVPLTSSQQAELTPLCSPGQAGFVRH